ARWHDRSGRCSGRRRGTRAADQAPGGGHEGDHQGDPQFHDCVRTVHLKRDFQGLVDRGGAAEPIGRWGLAEIERLFVRWHRFKAGELDGHELRLRLIPLQARLGRLLRRGQESPDRKTAGLCRELRKWWPALWTFAQVEGVEPTNNVSERALRPVVLW